MSPPAISVLVALAAVGLVFFGRFVVRQERDLRRSREESESQRAIETVRPNDVTDTLKAIARLQRAHEATRTTVGLIQNENLDLKDELTWLLAELEVRPEPHPVVRLLHRAGPLTLGQIRDAIPDGNQVPLDALVNSFQVRPVVDNAGEDLRYEFVPHSARPSTGSELGPINRYLALLVEVESEGEGPLGELDPRPYQSSASAA